MTTYESLFSRSKVQDKKSVFASFFPPRGESFDIPFQMIASKTPEGIDGWSFKQSKYQLKYSHITSVPKLKNYLDYTFLRAQTLDIESPGIFFVKSVDGQHICFNTGLQDNSGYDLIIFFERHNSNPNNDNPPWVYQGTLTPQQDKFIDTFGDAPPELPWYTKDTRDYVYDLSYHDLSPFLVLA